MADLSGAAEFELAIVRIRASPALAAITAERLRAHKKWTGQTTISAEVMAGDDPYWLSVLGEEVGEAAAELEGPPNSYWEGFREQMTNLGRSFKALNDGVLPVPQGPIGSGANRGGIIGISNPAALHAELIQVAAMAAAWADAIERDARG